MYQVLVTVLALSYLRCVTSVGFVTLIAALTLLAKPLAVEAQPERNMPRIGVLGAAASIADMSGSNPKESGMRSFLEGMRELGWVDGQNIRIERRSAEGHPDRFPLWRRRW